MWIRSLRATHIDWTGRRRFATACCGKREFGRYVGNRARGSLLDGEGPEGAVVTDWPGALKFRVRHKRVGSHNLAGRRVDVWFTDSDGREWHGVNYGHNSQLCHCRRLRSAA